MICKLLHDRYTAYDGEGSVAQRLRTLHYPIHNKLREYAVINVGIVDSHPVVRLALRHLLQTQSDIAFVGEAKNAIEALELIRIASPQVLIMDLDLPGRSGLDVLQLMRRQTPDMRVAIFTNYPEEQYALKLFSLGALAYVPKSSEPEVLLGAVRKIVFGKRCILPSQTELIITSAHRQNVKPHDNLTHRELQVLLKLARGANTRHIAENLALSLKSVSSYRTRLLKKLNATSNGDLTYYVLKNDLLD
ncbi:MAG: response regulator transcription factor [Pedobacter sp.]|nr:MAG: response regulator transcription factor [Pedobacter sp.]